MKRNVILRCDQKPARVAPFRASVWLPWRRRSSQWRPVQTWAVPRPHGSSLASLLSKCPSLSPDPSPSEPAQQDPVLVTATPEQTVTTDKWSRRIRTVRVSYKMSWKYTRLFFPCVYNKILTPYLLSLDFTVYPFIKQINFDALQHTQC